MLIDLAFLAVFLIGLVPWGETRRPAIDKTLFLLGYLFVPIAGIYIASLVKPVYMGSRYLIMVSPAYYLALGVGLDTIAKRSRLVSALSLVVLVAGMLISDYNYFFDARYRTKEDYRDAARYIETHEWPDDVIVVDAPENITAFTHYYRGTLPIIGLPKVALWGNKDKKWSDLETFYVARKHSRVWLVLCRTMFSDPDELVRKWLDQYAFKINEVVFPSYGSPVMLGLYTYNSKYPKYKQPILNTPTTLPADAVNFENQLTLVSYQLVKSDVPAGERALVTINWLPQVDRLLDYKISLRLVDGEGHSWGQVDQMPFNFYFPTSQWPKSKVVREGYDLPIRLGTPPGSYRLQVEVYQPTTLRGLEVIDANGIRHGTKATLGSVVVTRPDVPPSPDTLAIQHRTDARWGDVIQLLGYDLASEEVKPGDTLALMLTYRVLHRPNTDLGLHLQLVNDQGREVAGRDFALTSPYPVSSWAAGDVLVGQYGLVVPAATPGGRYRLRAVLYDPATSRALDAHQPGWWPLGGGAIDLASIAVLGREVHTEVPPIQHLLRATIDGKVELLGYDLDASEAKPGGSVRLTVHWRALAAMDTSYTVFAHLVGPDGKIWGQKDSVPVDGTRPTTGWLTGEVIADRYEIPLRADAPPGDYVLEVGLYDAATGARLQAVDASGQRLLDDRIILTQIHVAP
jgi:hypothetical protein